MEGHAVISHDVLASYAADAAREVEGVHELVDGPRRHRGVRVAEEDGAHHPRGARRASTGAPSAPEVGDRGPAPRGGVPEADGEAPVGRRRRRVAGVAGHGRLMRAGVSGLTRGTIRSAPSVCRDCVWWQSRGNRTASKERWMERAEEDWGEWGTIYLDEGDRLLGSLQYGPSHLFPRAADLPAGPASEDAVLVTCSYLSRNGAEWIEKSLLLAAIGESRDRGAKALEAFAYRYPGGRVGRGALPRPPHGLPARLPRRVRVRDGSCAGSRRAVPPRARRPRPGRGGDAGEGAARRPGGVHPDAGAGAAAVTRIGPGHSASVWGWTGNERGSRLTSGQSEKARRGAAAIPAKVKCCGFPVIQAREDTALAELIQPIEQAKRAGADAIVTPCPLCHLSLDAWQSKLK